MRHHFGEFRNKMYLLMNNFFVYIQNSLLNLLSMASVFLRIYGFFLSLIFYLHNAPKRTKTRKDFKINSKHNKLIKKKTQNII